jgi:NADPH2:quinone reductase
MKAIVCEAFGGPEVLAWRDLPDPPPPAAGQLQVRLLARGAQYVDVLMLTGKYQFRPEPPFIPGGEAAGEIVAIGPGVTGFTVGQQVMTRHSPGSFCTLANATASACDLIPAALTLEEAAVFRGAYHTAYHALLQKGRLKAGDWVLIHGAAGGIGIPAIQIAKLFGARVIATASTEEKRAACLAEGADHAIDYRGGFRDQVKALTGGKGADIVYDPIGAEVFDESMRCLNWGARILILGFLGGAPALAKTNHLLIKGAEAVGVRIGGVSEFQPELAAANMRALLQLAAEGKLKPRISHRFPLERAADAIQAIIDRKVIGKAVLVG